MIIISRCPFRISLLGGSSDLDWYVNQNGIGLSVGFSIKLYSRVILSHRESSNKGLLNYSSREEYKDIDSISHPIIRSCLKRFNINRKLELCSIGENLSGSGLGSSSSFTVSLINAISKLYSLKLNEHEIAHHASEIEITDLRNPIGRQDQYLCALGGVNILEFKPRGIVNSINQSSINSAIEEFSKKLYLINTKISRSATEKLSDLKKKENTTELINNLLKIATTFIDKSINLNKNDIQQLLEISMLEAWKVKKKMHGVMTRDLINIENLIINSDFSVLKLLGAGGGGYFLVLFKGKNIEKAKSSLVDNGLNISSVELSSEGCSTCLF